MNHGAGKGCAPRPVDKKTWDKNYARIFGKNKGSESGDGTRDGTKK